MMIARVKILNSTLVIGLVGMIFYSFQGYMNFLILFYVYLICCLSILYKKYLGLHILLILLPLILIKYSQFLINDILNIGFSLEYINKFEIPPGLSFISFSAIALILYLRNNIENYSTKLSYLFFFPQLIAGPIVEPKALIPQLKFNLLSPFSDILKGLFIFSIGISIKVLFADNIGEFIDPVFLNLEAYDLNEKIIAIFLFSQQIFFDFNGYTLMAIGVGITLGIKLPENFDAPYLSQSISDFWKKWHITLSNWIKNYIYIPLGGSRSGTSKRYVNIFLAMLASGIWHGAGINFLIWGMLHGVIIIVEKIFLYKILLKIPVFLRIFYSYFIVTILWLFFRINDFDEVKKFFEINDGNILSINLVIILLVILILNWSQKFITIKYLTLIFYKINKFIIVPTSIILIFVCILISKGTSEKFIYFNF